MKLSEAILNRLKSRIGQAALTVLAATLILRFPILTAWLDESFRSVVMKTADSIRTLALPALLVFTKQWNETGGDKPITPEAKERVEMDKP